MPKIPTYERRVSIPGEAPAVFSNVHDQTGEGISNIGKGLMDIADVLIEREQKIKIKDRQIKYLGIKNELVKWLDQIEIDEAQKTNEEALSNIDRFSKGEEENKKRFLSMAGDDKLLSAEVEALFDEKTGNTKHQLARLSIAARKSLKDQRLKDLLEQGKKDVANGKDWQKTLAGLESDIMSMVPTGNLGESEAKALAQVGREELGEIYISNAIDSNPSEALSLLESKKLKEFIPAEKVNRYKDQAKAKIEALARDAKQEAREARIEASLARKEQQDAADRAWLVAVLNKKESHSLLKSLSGTMSEAGLSSAINHLEAKEKAAERIKPLKSDRVVEAKMWSQINIMTADEAKGKELDVRRELADQVVSEKLTPEDATRLTTDLEKRIKDVDPYQKSINDSAIKFLANARTDKMFVGGSKAAKGNPKLEQLNDERYAQASNMLRFVMEKKQDVDPLEYAQALINQHAKDSLWDDLSSSWRNELTPREQAQKKVVEIGQPAKPQLAVEPTTSTAKPTFPGRIPSFADFFKKIREDKKYIVYSDEEIRAFYNQQYPMAKQ